MKTKPKIWLQGSCATRDPLQGVIGEIEIVRYRARSSLISLVSEPIEPPPLDPTGIVDFEYRNVLADFEKSWLAQWPSEGICPVFDFIDERFGVIDVGGRWFTYSTALTAVAERAEILRLGRFVAPQSTEYADLLLRAADTFLERVPDPRRILVHEARWAERFEDGRVCDVLGAGRSEAMNATLDRLYAALRAGGVETFALDAEDYVAATEHRWGPAPFHYSTGVERRIAEGLLARLSPAGDAAAAPSASAAT